MTRLVMVGACYVDTILRVDHYPKEDEKLRASSVTRRRGGNCPNSLEVLEQLVQRSRANATLDLVAVLPSRSSPGSQFIRDSLGPAVSFNHCIYRENISDPASSYVIRSQSTDSRTIINFNELPEMTVDEFGRIVSQLTDREDYWFHFEGRIPDTTLECIHHLHRSLPHATISVEVEKPGRAGLENLAAEADLVFYSKSWAQAKGYTSAEQCLRDQANFTPKARHLCCTWGEKGADVLELPSRTHVSVPAYTEEGSSIVDTIGAGDTFVAGMIFGLMCRRDDWDLLTKVRFANELAGRKVFQEGFAGLGTAMKHWL
ncbi:hypothetical protein VTN31DRAFT_4755 [Thermomyces dupontii]|uniref:uncharacterized protein n=1 Tax=Talaromyces thermophilus TaxID=28565 RepID=UPI003743E144